MATGPRRSNLDLYHPWSHSLSFSISLGRCIIPRPSPCHTLALVGPLFICMALPRGLFISLSLSLSLSPSQPLSPRLSSFFLHLSSCVLPEMHQESTTRLFGMPHHTDAVGNMDLRIVQITVPPYVTQSTQNGRKHTRVLKQLIHLVSQIRQIRSNPFIDNIHKGCNSVGTNGIDGPITHVIAESILDSPNTMEHFVFIFDTDLGESGETICCQCTTAIQIATSFDNLVVIRIVIVQ